jgi:hypothetical protein
MVRAKTVFAAFTDYLAVCQWFRLDAFLLHTTRPESVENEQVTFRLDSH